MKQLLLTFILYSVFSTPFITTAAEPDAEIHTELRALLTGIEAAVNTEKYSDLAQYFHKDLRVTTVNQNTISSHPEIAAYFKEWFGEGGYLVSLKMSLKPDALTELYNNKTMGIVRGSGIEKYKLTDGRDLDLNTRWTATVIKDTDSKWRIVALHLGTNFYDNAIYNEMRSYLIKVALIAGLVSVLFGFIAGYFLRARRQKR
ncbi:MAG: hypothetical protein L3J51_06640 [Cocleimonas sp.]|nr:hypothetical protein [Cocleimonas sp.]